MLVFNLGDRERVDSPESYDDAITAGLILEDTDGVVQSQEYIYTSVWLCCHLSKEKRWDIVLSENNQPPVGVMCPAVTLSDCYHLKADYFPISAHPHSFIPLITQQFANNVFFFNSNNRSSFYPFIQCCGTCMKQIAVFTYIIGLSFFSFSILKKFLCQKT